MDRIDEVVSGISQLSNRIDALWSKRADAAVSHANKGKTATNTKTGKQGIIRGEYKRVSDGVAVVEVSPIGGGSVAYWTASNVRIDAAGRNEIYAEAYKIKDDLGGGFRAIAKDYRNGETYKSSQVFKTLEDARNAAIQAVNGMLKGSDARTGALRGSKTEWKSWFYPAMSRRDSIPMKYRSELQLIKLNVQTGKASKDEAKRRCDRLAKDARRDAKKMGNPEYLEAASAFEELARSL